MGKKLKWNLIVMSVLYLALGIFLLMVPGTALNVVCYALGGVVLLGAVIQLSLEVDVKKLKPQENLVALDYKCSNL